MRALSLRRADGRLRGGHGRRARRDGLFRLSARRRRAPASVDRNFLRAQAAETRSHLAKRARAKLYATRTRPEGAVLGSSSAQMAASSARRLRGCRCSLGRRRPPHYIWERRCSLQASGITGPLHGDGVSWPLPSASRDTFPFTACRGSACAARDDTLHRLLVELFVASHTLLLASLAGYALAASCTA